ncbi:hypothetical protein O181_001885 [Austropuccinia psidii MF-1]|uniref:Uncharacterized protein n=1 Tax=Austropuccinia psidii MF-1 TaxID=1389203 RepID=A0A9Q3BBD8_9BASI|nr:hypothetical protein [Austropuccinia psidii MF-1]
MFIALCDGGTQCFLLPVTHGSSSRFRCGCKKSPPPQASRCKVLGLQYSMSKRRNSQGQLEPQTLRLRVPLSMSQLVSSLSPSTPCKAYAEFIESGLKKIRDFKNSHRRPFALLFESVDDHLSKRLFMGQRELLEQSCKRRKLEEDLSGCVSPAEAAPTPLDSTSTWTMYEEEEDEEPTRSIGGELCDGNSEGILDHSVDKENIGFDHQ